MNKEQIKHTQRVVGTDDDGIWGPKSRAAAQAYLRSLMPKVSPWPKQDEASLLAFYGRAGDTSRLVGMDAPVPMFFEGVRVKTVRCHEKVAESLSRALKAGWEASPGTVQIYDGCYNYRPMRGSSTPSLHARGAAIDLDAGHNGMGSPWPTGADMPIEVMAAFAREGWLSGAFWSREDSMHFQATQ